MTASVDSIESVDTMLLQPDGMNGDAAFPHGLARGIKLKDDARSAAGLKFGHNFRRVSHSSPDAVERTAPGEQESGAVLAVELELGKLVEGGPSGILAVERNRALVRGRSRSRSHHEIPGVDSGKLVREPIVARKLRGSFLCVHWQKQDDELVPGEAAGVDRSAAGPGQIDVRNSEIEVGGEHARVPPARDDRFTPWEGAIRKSPDVTEDCVTPRRPSAAKPRAMDAAAREVDARAHGALLRVRRIHLHTQREPIVIMRTDCPVCRSEGLAPRSQVLLRANGRELIAVLFQGADNLLGIDEIGLSEAAWELLGAAEGEWAAISHPPALKSMGAVRSRIFGETLEGSAFDGIVSDVVAGRYSDVQLAAFLTAGSALPLTDDETVALTGAMARAGEQLHWAREAIDKHSVGGLPGNRTTPIVVAIAAAAGLTIPKTSSRAITSPAGTADAMETVTRVDLDLATIRRIVEREGGCLAWGGALHLSPADDIFIGVERQLDIDPEGQLIASVLSKKIAAGASRVVLDIPVGPTAKVRSSAAGHKLALRMRTIAAHFGLEALSVISDGTQPVGRAIGPALEMRDVLSVLRLEPQAPADLRERALAIAAAVLELGRAAVPEAGFELARQLLADGSAYRKFDAICRAQGAFREPPQAALQQGIASEAAGRIAEIDNRKLARIAKFAGAPDDAAAGLIFHVRLGDRIERGQPLMTLHANTGSELAYALDYARSVGNGIRLEA